MSAEIRLVAYSDASTFGGAEQCLAVILAGLPATFRVTVMATDGAVGERVAAARPGADVVLVAAPSSFWDLRTVASHWRALRRLAADVCLLNLRMPYSCLHATAAALLLRSTRLVAVEHLSLPSQSRAARLLKRIASKRLAAHLAVSEYTAGSVATAASIRADSIRVVPNGVPEPSGGTVDLELPNPLVGTVGRLEKQKGFDVLIDALGLLPGVSAVVAGEGPERDALMRRAQARGVADRFTLIGWQEEIGPFLRALDVFVLPSRFEGLSLALLEAMAAGTAIVATDVGGTSEALVPGETGLLVPPEDADGLASAIDRLLRDEELRKQLGAAAREAWVARFTAQRMQQSYADLLAAVVR
jgi:glycosyltransferase involved in cell wall biosynthesis